MKISWRWTCSQIFRKFSYCENLWLFWMQHLLIFRLWAIMFTQERAPRQTFTYSNSTTEALKIKCEICSMLAIKTSGQRCTLFIVNLEHISLLFILFSCWPEVPPYQFINVEITCCCNYWQTCKNLSEIKRKDS